MLIEVNIFSFVSFQTHLGTSRADADCLVGGEDEGILKDIFFFICQLTQFAD